MRGCPCAFSAAVNPYVPALIFVLALPSLHGCTWVAPDAKGAQVRVAESPREVASCKVVETVTVSVRDKLVGSLERNPVKVRDELESLARNAAGSSGADTVLAVSDVNNGEQEFKSYRCN
jgi:hypothetical protein